MSQRLRLLEGAQALGLGPTGAQVDQLLAYGEFMLRWNRVYNLTAIRELDQVITHHLLDCLALVAPLMRTAPDAQRLLDVGAGAGLPGAVVAIMSPAITVTCVDAVAKKMAFVQQVSAALAVPNLRACHSRVEALAGSFDVITARAFASLATLFEGTSHLLAPNGVWVAMKGRVPDEEIAGITAASVEVFHVEPLVVPGLEAERCLVWARKIPA